MSKLNVGDIVPASAMCSMNCEGIVVHLSQGKAHVLPLSSLIEIPNVTDAPSEPASSDAPTHVCVKAEGSSVCQVCGA